MGHILAVNFHYHSLSDSTAAAISVRVTAAYSSTFDHEVDSKTHQLTQINLVRPRRTDPHITTLI